MRKEWKKIKSAKILPIITRWKKRGDMTLETMGR
jgi:hypothetical protein